MTITQYQNPILRVICTQNPGHIAIKSLNSSNNMIKLSKSPFDNKRLDLAPSFIVEELLGFQFT